MTQVTGILRKMYSELASPVHYALAIGEERLPLNPHLGQRLQLTFTGQKFCIHCTRKTSKTFQQGYCFVCYRRLLDCNLCIIHPERCRVETGGCPEHDWAHAQCNAPHIVYLANASGLKVGITRETQVPTRWIDQGAVQALPIFSVSNRYRAGIVEVAFKHEVHDKTNWRRMLQQQPPLLNLPEARDELLERLKGPLAAISAETDQELRPLEAAVVSISYPVTAYPAKINSLSFDRQHHVVGNLIGVKGQYLYLDHGVINLRAFGGYEVTAELFD